MKYTLLLVLLVLSIATTAQTNKHMHETDLPGMIPGNQSLSLRTHNLLLSKANYAPKAAAKTTAGGPDYIFDTSRWSHIVDSTWGVGLPDSAKMQVFNHFWGQMDSFYACFVNLPAYNWDSIVAAIDTQIMHGVSKGRFAAMGNAFMTLINDGHSGFRDIAVNYSSMIYRGLPLFRGESGKFGACITTLNDSSALVYNAHAGHPFDLQPGDIILGYNGEPWTKLVQTILRNQLPNAVYIGSTNAATMHRYIQAAGENWYLFDTINIKKCDGSIVNLPTSLMTGVFYQDFCTEQMPVAGIHKTTYSEYYGSGIEISAGVINGKKIGYVYMYDCSDATGMNLLNAVRTLVEDSMVQGLIFDIRTNFGGGFNAYIKTFKYLHSGHVSWVGYGDRFDMNRTNLYNYGLPAWYDITDDDANFFPHRIAVLCGPNSISAGDFFPVLFKHCPKVKIFGKSTAGAYGSSTGIALPHSGFAAGRQVVNFFEVGAATSYITHVELPVDSSVWFNKDSVCAGIDNMVNTAVRWIEDAMETGVQTNEPQLTMTIYPNPAKDQINCNIGSNTDESIRVTLCNMLGSVLNESQYTLVSGNNILKMDIAKLMLPTGNYYLKLEGSNGTNIVKKLTIMR